MTLVSYTKAMQKNDGLHKKRTLVPPVGFNHIRHSLHSETSRSTQKRPPQQGEKNIVSLAHVNVFTPHWYEYVCNCSPALSRGNAPVRTWRTFEYCYI